MQVNSRVITSLTVLVSTLASASGAVGGPPQHWPIEAGGNGHWYQLREKVGDWNACRAAAIAIGGDLASVGNGAENQFIEGVIPEKQFPVWNRVFLGGVEDPPGSGTWRWVDGTAWTFTDWQPGQPNGGEGYLVAMRDDPGPEWCYWGDYGVDSTDIYFFLIEWSADCNGDGIVDQGQILAGELADTDDDGVPDCCETSTSCVLLTTPIQWAEASGGNGHWYARLGVSPSESAEDHFMRAASLAAHTVTIGTAEENALCAGLLGDATALIGVRKIAGTNEGAWVTGEAWSYTNWQRGEGGNASERYALMPPVWAGFWQDTDLTPYASSLIEWDADCNADGIVDYGQILSGDLADANGNNIPDCCEGSPACNCFGDVTGNRVVDGVDLAAMLGAWGTSGQGQFDCDVNNDGIVDGADLAVLLGDWGTCQ